MWPFSSRSEYQVLNEVHIRADALRANHQALQAFHPEAQIVPVLKSNAYGHGLTTVGPIFDSLRAPFLAVDSLYEAYELHKAGIRTPLLIMGYTAPSNLAVKRLPFAFVVYDLEIARALNQFQPGAEVHLFVDTGMNREGIPLNQLPAFITELKKLSHLQVRGITSHLADADNPTSEHMTTDQLTAFRQALTICEQAGVPIQWRHLSASGGAYKLKAPELNMIRAGLASYGWSPLSQVDNYASSLTLQPALEFVSTLVQIKTVPAGTKVGYNATYTTTKKTVLGLLPAGYYEGVDRRLSSKGVVIVKGQACPILGRVSMNMTTIDVTGVENPQVGDRAIIYSRELVAPNSVAAAAELAGTIPYELLVHLAESVRRTVT